MKKTLWIATILLVAGILIGVVTLALVDFDFYKLDSSQFVTKTHEVNGTFTNIQVYGDMSNIHFVPATDGYCKVTSRIKEYMDCTVLVEDNTLVIRETDHRKWYQYINMYFEDGDITVYLPAKDYNILIARTDTGDITIPKDFTFETATLNANTGDIRYCGGLNGNLKAEVNTGDIILENINTFGSIGLEADTGDVKLTNVVCRTLRIETDTGDVKLKKCNADAIDAETDTGDITGSLLEDKVIFAHSSTGSVKVPETANGVGKCTLKTDTGDIRITIE